MIFLSLSLYIYFTYVHPRVSIAEKAEMNLLLCHTLSIVLPGKRIKCRATLLELYRVLFVFYESFPLLFASSFFSCSLTSFFRGQYVPKELTYSIFTFSFIDSSNFTLSYNSNISNWLLDLIEVNYNLIISDYCSVIYNNYYNYYHSFDRNIPTNYLLLSICLNYLWMV